MATIKGGLGIFLGIVLALLVGCQSNKSDDGMAEGAPMGEAPAMQAQPVEQPAIPEPVQPKRPETRMGVLWTPEAAGAEMVQVESRFYFDFDQAIVKRTGFAALGQHAGYLSGNPGISVRLEGHADERGTRENNLALGERRANAVAAYLRAQGVSARQVEVISYGEEKPATMGHDETSWARNRRVELIYR